MPELPAIGDALTRKIGPLPVWAWGGVVGGGILIVRVLSGGGASSSHVQTIATPDNFNFDPTAADAGGSGGGTPWYATIPGVGTIIDRPPGQVTVLPTPGTGTITTPIANLVAKFRVAISGRTQTYSASGKPLGEISGQTVSVGDRIRVGGKWLYPITSGKYKGRYIAPTSATTFSAIGDTYAVADTYPMGDTTPLTPQVLVPAQAPRPLPLRTWYDTDMGYRAKGDHGKKGEPIEYYTGQNIDIRTPIASSARVVMPAVNGETTGSVTVPRLPKASARAGRTSPGRLFDPLARVADRLSASVPPTTRRLPVVPLPDIRDRIPRLNPSG